MKSYKEMSEEAGVDVETIRGIAKTIKRGESGAWLTNDGETYPTKAQAIVEAAKAWKAAKDERDAQEAERLDMYRKAQDAMSRAGIEIPADPQETMRAAERIQAMATVTGVSMEQLSADDVKAAVEFNDYMVLTVKAAPKTVAIVRDMARYDGKTWETAHFGKIPEGACRSAGVVPTPEAWEMPTLMVSAVDGRGDVNVVLRWVRRNGTRDVFETDAQKGGARLEVEVSKIVSGGAPSSLLALWTKRGFTPPMREAWNLETSASVTPGGSTAFEWTLEANAENRWRLLVEVLKRWAE